MTFSSVIDLQKQLRDEKFYAGLIDGDFGPLTLAGLDLLAGTDAPWMDVARAEYGVSELYGTRHNPRILEYHSTTGKFDSDEVPWCSSFVNWTMRRTAINGTNNAMARSWLRWGKQTAPRYGAIVIYPRGTPPSGHVAFYLCTCGDRDYVLGGNQGNRVSIAPNRIKSYIDLRWPA